MSVLIFFTSRHYYFFGKIKIEVKNLRKIICSYIIMYYKPLISLVEQKQILCTNLRMFKAKLIKNLYIYQLFFLS